MGSLENTFFQDKDFTYVKLSPSKYMLVLLQSKQLELVEKGVKYGQK